ncbi:hypothetical protein MKW98_019701, partial [Papaver atlanticum]
MGRRLVRNERNEIVYLERPNLVLRWVVEKNPFPSKLNQTLERLRVYDSEDYTANQVRCKKKQQTNSRLNLKVLKKIWKIFTKYVLGIIG